MQKENMSLFEASFLLESALTVVKQQRAVTLSESLGTDTTFKERRVIHK